MNGWLMSNGASLSSSKNADTLSEREQIIQHVKQIENEMFSSWREARNDGSVDKFGNAGGDEIDAWLDGLLRFGDQLPAVSYSHGISWEILTQSFPQFFSVRYHYDQVKGSDWPSFDDLINNDLSHVPAHIVDEINDKTKWDWEYMTSPLCKSWQGLYTSNYKQSVCTQDQIDFITANKSRTPRRVLEIGGGRGEIAHFMSALDIPCSSIEPGQYAKTLYDYTNVLFFGGESSKVTLLDTDVKHAREMIDLTEFDTVIFCESIEHIPEDDFWKFWAQIKKQFRGRIVITNWVWFHPIPVAFPEHIFAITDDVYDKLIADSQRCAYRNQSHLVLEI